MAFLLFIFPDAMKRGILPTAEIETEAGQINLYLHH